jgi:hypothetical protein
VKDHIVYPLGSVPPLSHFYGRLQRLIIVPSHPPHSVNDRLQVYGVPVICSLLFRENRFLCLFQSSPPAGRCPEAGWKRLIPFVLLFIRLGASLDKKVDVHREFSPPSIFPVLRSNVAEKLRFVIATSDHLTTLNGPYFICMAVLPDGSASDRCIWWSKRTGHFRIPHFALCMRCWLMPSLMMVSGNHHRRHQWPLADICREVFLLYLATLDGTSSGANSVVEDATSTKVV